MVIAAKYRVDAVVGSGGMGIVFAATHLQLKERFAIKILHPEASLRTDSVERFLREARVAMKLRGEHVVRIYDVGTLDDSSPFIAMECLEGRDLRTVLLEDGKLDPSTAVEYVLHACEAIAEAHALGVIHRDLKPANLFLTHGTDGAPSVKVLDFGVSKIRGTLAAWEDPLSTTSPARDPDAAPESVPPDLAETTRAPGITRTRALLGSPRYMAPEQLRSPRDVDVRADIWALGAILFELLAGEPPFDGDSLDELRRAVTSAPAPPLRGTPPQLEWVVHRCLAKSPRQRFAGVSELAEALRPFASEEGARCIHRVARLARGPLTSSGSTIPALPATPVGATEDAVVDVAHRRPGRRAWMTTALAAAAVASIAALLLVPARTAPASIASRDAAVLVGVSQETRGGGPAPPSATSEKTLAIAPAPLEGSSAEPEATLAPPRAAPARTHAPTRRAATPSPPSAGVPAPAPPATPAPAARDPLRVDGGLLFDERK
jgi:serine/threonine protein kinase